MTNHLSTFTTFAPPIVDILVIALAALRISFFLVSENGPWNFMLRLRWWLRRPAVLTCIYCVSGWVIMALIPLYYLAPWNVGRWLISFWAIWGLMLVIRSYTGFGLDK